jgi:hypothetical protein
MADSTQQRTGIQKVSDAVLLADSLHFLSDLKLGELKIAQRIISHGNLHSSGWQCPQLASLLRQVGCFFLTGEP